MIPLAIINFRCDRTVIANRNNRNTQNETNHATHVIARNVGRLLCAHYPIFDKASQAWCRAIHGRTDEEKSEYENVKKTRATRSSSQRKPLDESKVGAK